MHVDGRMDWREHLRDAGRPREDYVDTVSYRPDGRCRTRQIPPSPTRRGRSILVLAAVLGALVGVVPAAQAGASRGGGGGDPAVVVTDDGAVRGLVTGDHRSFLGIPYAAPPVGERRWELPQPVSPWTTTRDATTPGSDCPQLGSGGAGGSVNEDCLYLNVTTPPSGRSHHLPVMVWIHGGGFATGSGRSFQAQRLLEGGDVMLVTLNYRLGALGFLAHPALDVPGVRSGDYGLADQQAALRWVRRNARAFGGDPGNVTLFGESAGATSVCAQLAAPGSAGLLQRAIVQSGPCVEAGSPGQAKPIPIARAQANGVAVAGRLGCADPRTAGACLHAAPVEGLLSIAGSSLTAPAFLPAFGGDFLPQEPGVAITSGRFNRVPVIQGTNRDEHRLFVAITELISGQPLTEDEYRAMLESTFADQAPAVLAAYPSADYGSSPGLALATVLTDSEWSCPALDTARSLGRHTRTWAYEFADEQAPFIAGLPPLSFPVGAFHSAELQYLFAGGAFPDVLNPAQERLSQQMVRYWVGFARTGEPGGDGSTLWPPFRRSGYVQSLAPGERAIHRVDLGQEHHCDFWAQHPLPER
jgi:para-nitrobenzyl esterase